MYRLRFHWESSDGNKVWGGNYPETEEWLWNVTGNDLNELMGNLKEFPKCIRKRLKSILIDGNIINNVKYIEFRTWEKDSYTGLRISHILSEVSCKTIN